MKKLIALFLLLFPIVLFAQYQVTLLSSSNGIAQGESENYKAQIAVGQQLSGQITNNSSTVYIGLLPLINGKNTSVDDILLKQNHLFANYPNPWTSTTTIPIRLHKTMKIKLQIFDSNGKLVKTVADGNFAEGYHFITVSDKGMNSGLYIYQLQTIDTNITRTMLFQ